jgi:hypothetical protein
MLYIVCRIFLQNYAVTFKYFPSQPSLPLLFTGRDLSPFGLLRDSPRVSASLVIRNSALFLVTNEADTLGLCVAKIQSVICL